MLLAARRRFLSLGALAFLSVVSVALAGVSCSSRSSATAGVSCLSDPTVCAEGETCWPTSASTFSCIASKPGAGVGASCSEAYNVATCADGMLCDSTSPDGEGECAQYCSTTIACPTGYACRTTQVGTGGVTVDVCRVAPLTPTPSEDAGDDQTFEGGELPDIKAFLDVFADTGPIRQ